MVVFDCHTHMGKMVWGGIWGMKGVNYWGAEQALQVMDRNDVDKAIVCATTTTSFKAMNDSVNEEIKKAEGRLIGFVRVNPNEGETVLEEIDMRVKSQGWKGIKLHPTLSAFPLVDTRTFPVFEKAKELKVPILVHTGSEIFTSPAQVALAAEIYPEVTIIMAHMGSPWLVKQSILVAKRRDNVVIDTSVQPNPILIREAVKTIGAERVLFGSDLPFQDQYLELKKLERADLTEDELRWVRGDAIAKILEKVPTYT